MTRPTLAESIVVSEFWKNRRGEVVRVQLSNYACRTVADIRTWFTAGGRLHPGKGFAADVKHLPRLVTALTKAVAKASELGLITADNHGGDQ